MTEVDKFAIEAIARSAKKLADDAWKNEHEYKTKMNSALDPAQKAEFESTAMYNGGRKDAAVEIHQMLTDLIAAGKKDLEAQKDARAK